MNARRSGSTVAHEPALDGVRGIAIVLVLLQHFAGYTLATTDGLGTRLLLAGWMGVDLFFVLSGFLITSILVRLIGRPRWVRTFYVRRALRILPLYYGTLIVMLLILPRVLPVTPGIETILANQRSLWLYYMNYVRISSFDSEWLYLGHFWSLAVEEQFYLVWPALLALFGAARWRKILLVLIPLAFVVQFGAIAFSDSLGPRIHAYRPMGIIAGSLLALMRPLDRNRQPDAPPPWTRIVMLVAAAVVSIATVTGAMHELHYPSFDPGISAIRILVFAAVIALFLGLVDAAHRPTRIASLLAIPVLRFAGRYSYGIYVYHYVLMAAFARLFGQASPAVYVLLATTITICIAVASYHLFEHPFHRLKDRLAPG